MDNLRECPQCKEEVDRTDMVWVNDKYGIPFKLVCRHCEADVKKSIAHWELDESFAGERLENDY